jgi:hypothetical protein
MAHPRWYIREHDQPLCVQDQGCDSKEQGVSQPIEGHAASFAEMKQDGPQQ